MGQQETAVIGEAKLKPIMCMQPRPKGHNCVARFDDKKELRTHLVRIHGWSREDARKI